MGKGYPRTVPALACDADDSPCVAAIGALIQNDSGRFKTDSGLPAGRVRVMPEMAWLAKDQEIVT
jgi:hypothetical protein